MDDWQPIETAPKDRPVRAKRVYEGRVIYDGPAAWVHFRFAALPPHPLDGDIYAPAYEDDGWGYPPGHASHGKRVPAPTHWMPAVIPPSPYSPGG